MERDRRMMGNARSDQWHKAPRQLIVVALLLVAIPLSYGALANGAACSSSSECASGNCASDYDGSGSFCCASGYCGHDNGCYVGGMFGSRGPTCVGNNYYQCGSGGQWYSYSCFVGVSCSDDGSSDGGGTCKVHHSTGCSGGYCQSSDDTYADTCTGDSDNPGVRYYYCSGTSCVSSTTSRSDSCSAGSSSCSATNYYCSGGQIYSDGSSATAGCSGTCTQTSNVRCTASDGYEYDTCASTTTSSPGYTCTAGSCVAPSGRMVFKNRASGLIVAAFDKNGNILLKGGLFQSTATAPPANSFVVRDRATGAAKAWVTSNGDMYTKGTNQTQATLVPSGGNDFIIKERTANKVVMYIDGSTGNVYATGTIYQYTTP